MKKKKRKKNSCTLSTVIISVHQCHLKTYTYCAVCVCVCVCTAYIYPYVTDDLISYECRINRTNMINTQRNKDWTEQRQYSHTHGLKTVILTSLLMHMPKTGQVSAVGHILVALKVHTRQRWRRTTKSRREKKLRSACARRYELCTRLVISLKCMR